MKKQLLGLMTILTALGACQKNEVTSLSEDVTIHATIEEKDATRTVMDESNNILWTENDQIIAFMKSSYGHKYQVKPSFVGKSYADFSMVSSNNGSDLSAGNEWEHNVVYYPYSEDIECLKSGANYALEVNLPAEQTYVPDSFANGSMAMVAVSESNNITFKNVLGGIKLQLKGTQEVASIKIEGKNNEKLAGAATVTAYTDETKPAITMASGASTSVTLNCGSGVQLNESTATEFIITIPPTVFTKGFTVTFNYIDGKTYKIDTEKENDVIRSSLLVMPEITLDNSSQEESSERWVDLGLSVLWAAYNVGATTPEEYGGFYAWGETEEKSIYTEDNYKYSYKNWYGNNHWEWNWAYDHIGYEISGTSYDVAHVKWGDSARMPTLEEVNELICNCTFTRSTLNGIVGDYAIGPNGNSIFLPSAGSRIYDSPNYDGRRGNFWTSTRYGGSLESHAYYLMCDESWGGTQGSSIRDVGRSVRPVKDN